MEWTRTIEDGCRVFKSTEGYEIVEAYDMPAFQLNYCDHYLSCHCTITAAKEAAQEHYKFN